MGRRQIERSLREGVDLGDCSVHKDISLWDFRMEICCAKKQDTIRSIQLISLVLGSFKHSVTCTYASVVTTKNSLIQLHANIYQLFDYVLVVSTDPQLIRHMSHA